MTNKEHMEEMKQITVLVTKMTQIEISIDEIKKHLEKLDEKSVQKHEVESINKRLQDLKQTKADREDFNDLRNRFNDYQKLLWGSLLSAFAGLGIALLTFLLNSNV